MISDHDKTIQIIQQAKTKAKIVPKPHNSGNTIISILAPTFADTALCTDIHKSKHIILHEILCCILCSNWLFDLVRYY